MEPQLLDEIQQVIDSLSSQDNVTPMLAEQVKAWAQQFGTRTKLGNYNYVSNVKTLSTAQTVYLGSKNIESGAYTQKKRDIRKSAPSTVRSVNEYLKRAPLVKLDATMGHDSDYTPKCTLYLSTYRKDSIRLAHMVAETLFDGRGDDTQPLTVVFIPEWQEKDRQVLVFPEIGVTYILGTDYYGEAKNAFLRMAMWNAKQLGMLGLHAGTQLLNVRSDKNSRKLRKVGLIIFGIAATGKTTHACHDHGLARAGECVEIVQDDVVFWRKDGSALGSERAFYMKTEGLTEDVQPLLYTAINSNDAILENVMVDHLGNVDFNDRTLTANGHGIVQRAGLGTHASETVNLPPLDELDRLILTFMVRNYTVVPVASKLTPEQAAVAFMLSEPLDAAGSEMQAANPTAGGIGASPFIIGDAVEEVNLFYDLLKSHSDKIECYMLNTGGVGEIVEHGLDGSRRVKQKVTRVEIPEMGAIIRSIARGTVKWREDPNWMTETPEWVEDLDTSKFELDKHYDQARIDPLIATIRLERAAYAEQFSGLNPAIRKAVEF